MAASEGPVVVPSESPSSCFKRDDFMKTSFSVDSFVSTYKGLVSLDVLKQDLEEYLKSLRHALIELINQDYADFVNLSTNLVGMDKSINNLSVPLGQLKEEVLLIRTELDGTIASIEGKLDARSQLRQKKICMQHLLNITKSLEKIERLLHGSLTDEPTSTGNESEDESHLIERVASEFNQLQFYVTQSQGHPLVENIRSRISAITLTLQKKLETAFQEGIQSGQFHLLARVLRTYAIIDKIRDAELLFRDVVVKPYMNEVIFEHILLADPVNGLQDIYTKVLDFIPNYCTNMIKITSGRLEDSNQGEQRTAIRGYDFIVNAVWPEVVELIEGRLPSIFAPGNPDAFHKRYTTSMWFVEKFESLCPSQTSVRRLRNHKSFSSFMSHWSLPVYFQIRFQEIAGRLETILSSPNTEVEGSFKTSVANVLWWGLQTCWIESVYIKALCHRFWKLTLQIISRVTQWLVMETLYSNQDDSESAKPQTSYFVYLLSDVNTLSSQIPKLFKEAIEPNIVSTGLQDHINVFEDALHESLRKLKEIVPTIEETIIKQVVKKSSAGLDAARNIPRLYRRTNKEIPNKPSAFVAMVTKPLQDFQQEYKDLVSTDQFLYWSSKVFQTIFERYATITSDVLTSIKKTEDSLLRLKKTRKGVTMTTSNTDNQGTMSDDDKIRLQFSLDVEEFRNMMRELKVKEDSCPAFVELSVMVRAAQSGSNGQTS
ncbi:conserved oligomeric Golgi complex subunit 2 [Exaiptasia diaphana]|uniref:Conserved oligomeric Golgi complex subunit 2 n=1 Tax=Exaiptasia diaphana TaxID=2652724 RepID=A0A913X8V5_EXADI|nr:conserved oligomeric Golgi complex subunit 2 [Exaiptasia diaphana]KXJ14443.1 Conserved oligomeric Golgi complex subunit 2 [Exaiptasia diaphana]